MFCFNTTKANAFDPNLLEPLLKLLRLSPSTAASLAKAEMYAGIGQKLSHKKAVVRLNLLRLVRNIMDACELADMGPGDNKLLRALFDDIQTLADRDAAVLVRNLASELVRLHINVDASDARSIGGMSTASSSRSRSGPRRNTSYTPPGLSASVSAPPMTPTHGHRPTQSASSGVAYIEVAATPRRSAVTATHDRDAALVYRPRSRDSAGGGSSTSSSSSSIPRRVSGDVAAAAAAAAAVNGSLSSKSRLPRQSMTAAGLGRPNLSLVSSAAGASRSESSMSNKENVGRTTVERTPAPATGSGRDAAAKRRSRAPSADVKWT